MKHNITQKHYTTLKHIGTVKRYNKYNNIPGETKYIGMKDITIMETYKPKVTSDNKLCFNVFVNVCSMYEALHYICISTVTS